MFHNSLALCSLQDKTKKFYSGFPGKAPPVQRKNMTTDIAMLVNLELIFGVILLIQNHPKISPQVSSMGFNMGHL